MSDLSFHIKHFMPQSEGEDLEQRTALFKAKEYSSALKAQVTSDRAYDLAAEAYEAANEFFHDEHCSLDRLKLAVTYCRNLVQAAVVAEFLERGERRQ